MKIMFVGLGLIGGSMALALNGYPELERYAVDCDEWTRFEALGRGAVRAAWPSVQEAPLGEMDVVVLCLHPEAAAGFVREHALRLRPGALLTDVCGVKRPIVDAVAALGDRPFVYLGGHPMAGRECGGFASATGDLFRGSHYILTPDDSVPAECVTLMRQLVTDGSVRRGLLRQRQQTERAIIAALADPANGFAAGLCQSLSRTLGEQLERMARDAEMRICA